MKAISSRNGSERSTSVGLSPRCAKERTHAPTVDR